ncbi:protein-disulfide reductase DsbD family protein [Rubrivirga sp. S365]|uniref:Protein-disulfide reductase DsbD family protein n=1 Tax=Rubrivirga litoralis TaxID=3075598 RepID=A0ABU3BNI4_9BACT|nr:MULTISPECIES: protein-disulfide reductase DsbD domain-containing protein [unclassified Rubrivirga]MDT0630785.1 protein-disulfide reductase DsbD family protein [Rubrivirga sp. F394]MDT7856455.1 protein-disulfide reductase DsbD family protein [Rubrivirga sp. S365]
MRALLTACALALVTLAAPASAQGRLGAPVRTQDVVDWSVRVQQAERGGEARVVLDAEIEPGWRLYAVDSPVGRPLAVTVGALPAGVEAAPLRQARPQEGYDEAFGSDYTYFAGRGRIVQPLRLSATAARGRHEVRGAVLYAVCDDSICLPPARAAFRVPLQVR